MKVFVDEEIKRERLSTCLKCDRVVKPPHHKEPENILEWWFSIRCRRCKCGLRPKTMLQFSKCPLRKWRR